MRLISVRRMHLWSLLAGAGWLGLATLPADAQIFHRGVQSYPPPPFCPVPAPTYPAMPPTAPPSGAPPSAGPTAPAAPQAPTVDLSAVAPESLLAGAGETTAFAPGMLGDSSSISVFNSSAKIAENESPRPLDRLLFSFNYYNNLDRATLNANGASIHNVQYFRYTFGVEKTFLDNNFSVGLRAPINNITADGRVTQGPFGPVAAPGLTDTEFGDLSVILKGVLAQNRETGSLISAGLVVTTATGPRHFPSAPAEPILVNGQRSTSLQPFVGAIWSSGNFFVHGFSSIEIPTNRADALLLFDDVGVGYYVYRNGEGDRLLTAIVPTFEVHVNDPLRDRGSAKGGGPDIIDLTTGATFEFSRCASLAVGLVTPVTGPKPFDFEILTHLNVRF
jgi:hypothetical protein